MARTMTARGDLTGRRDSANDREIRRAITYVEASLDRTFKTINYLDDINKRDGISLDEPVTLLLNDSSAQLAYGGAVVVVGSTLLDPYIGSGPVHYDRPLTLIKNNIEVMRTETAELENALGKANKILETKYKKTLSEFFFETNFKTAVDSYAHSLAKIAIKHVIPLQKKSINLLQNYMITESGFAGGSLHPTQVRLFLQLRMR